MSVAARGRMDNAFWSRLAALIIVVFAHATALFGLMYTRRLPPVVLHSSLPTVVSVTLINVSVTHARVPAPVVTLRVIEPRVVIRNFPDMSAITLPSSPMAASATPSTRPAHQHAPAPAAPVTPPPAPKTPVSYADQLLARLAAFRHYPAEALAQRREGTVVVRFVVDRNGTASGIQIVTSSGRMDFDQEARDTVARAQPLPIPPPQFTMPLTITLPIVYALSHRSD